MPRSYIVAAGCLVAVAALALGTAGSGAQERGAPAQGGQERTAQPEHRGAGHTMMHGHGEGRDWGDERRQRRLMRRVELLDTNKDGKVSLEEIHAEQKRLMAAADVDGDGALSVEEFRRRGRWFLRLRTVSFFDMLDADGDGSLSAAEINDPSARWFTRHDENKDKALDNDELAKSGWDRGRWRGRRR